MKLKLVISPTMDRWAKSRKDEHERIRMSKKAREFYQPTDWGKILLIVHGTKATKELKISQAPESEMRSVGAVETTNVGFVTSETYKELMGPGKKINEIWISEKTENITVGCDPEFVLVKDDGSAVYADTVFGDKWSDLGSDGPCAEIRPGPSNNIDEVINNISSLLNNEAKTKNILKYDWLGGATYHHPSMNRRYPIGGHIHLGLPREVISRGINEFYLKRVARVLDEMVALPLVRIDTPLPRERRAVLGYGKFEDIRYKTKTPFKFEWRVPSGIWMVHKDLARAVIGTTKAVTEEAWKRFQDSKFNHNFMLHINNENNLLSSFSCMDSEVVRRTVNESCAGDVSLTLINDIHNRLKQMSNYPQYKEIIDDFIKICCKNPPSNHRLSLKPSWLENKPLNL